jgi:hypothetical protein
MIAVSGTALLGLALSQSQGVAQSVTASDFLNSLSTSGIPLTNSQLALIEAQQQAGTTTTATASLTNSQVAVLEAQAVLASQLPVSPEPASTTQLLNQVTSQWASNPKLFDASHALLGTMFEEQSRLQQAGQTANLVGLNGVLPSTPYVNTLRWERSLNPTQFDQNNPKLGVLLAEDQRLRMLELSLQQTNSASAASTTSATSVPPSLSAAGDPSTATTTGLQSAAQGVAGAAASGSGSPQPVPEPSSWAMMIIGAALATVARVARKRPAGA